MVDTANILLIRLKSIGDIVLTLPAVHLMRANFPEARITYLVSKEHAPLLRGFAEVQAVLPLDRAVFRRRNLKAICTETLALWGKLRRGQFDLAVDFQGYGETACLARLAGAPRRWGGIYGPVRRWAYTQGVSRNDSLHPADWHRSLVIQCGLRATPARNEFVLPDSEIQTARARLTECGGTPARATIYLQPFTSSPHKDWPLANYLAVARQFRVRGLQVLFGGGPADRERLEPARQLGFPVAAGAPLLVSAGLIHLSTLAVGGDTGLLHLGVAAGRRVVMLMQSTAPGSTFPYQHPEWAVTPRSAEPVAGIPVEAVNDAVARGLEEIGAASALTGGSQP